MSCGASWHRTSCHVGQVSKGQVDIGPIDLGQIVLTPYFWVGKFQDNLFFSWAKVFICSLIILDGKIRIRF